MAEVEREGDDNQSRGSDWEVVSLTASAYAAAPGPKPVDPAVGKAEDASFTGKQASTDPMIVSGHFVFPPHEHENLPPDSSEIRSEAGDQDIIDEPGNAKKESDDGLCGIQLFDKEKSLSVDDVKFGEGEEFEGLSLAAEEKATYPAPEFGVFNPEANISQSVLCNDNADVTDDGEHSNVETPAGYTSDSKADEEDEHDGAGLPCDAWWKNQASSLYDHVKEASKFWPVVVAAAVVGLAILGHRWRRERVQLQQLTWKAGLEKETMNHVTGPVNRLKGVLVGSQPRSAWLGGDATF